MSHPPGLAIPVLASLKFGGSALPEDLDLELHEFYQRTDGKILFFDFSDAHFIDIATLVNCISILVARVENPEPEKQQTFFVYPRRKPVRDFLAAWRFPEAVEQATGHPFISFLVPQDHHYLTESQETYRGRGGGLDALEYDPDWNEIVGGQRNFFEFITFADKARSPIMPNGTLALVPRNETNRWAKPLIEQVLARHFGNGTSKTEIPRVVIFEAMSNAVRHPRAKLIQVVSRFYRAGAEGRLATDESEATLGSLRICIWDDGEAIADTLLKPLKAGKRIKAPVLPNYLYERVYVDLRLFDDREAGSEIVDQADDLNEKHATEARMLLSSLFPGVSRTLAEYVAHVPQPGSEESSPEVVADAAPGMGLYSLTRIVVDQFQGVLHIRSGRYRLRFQVADDEIRQKYSVRYYCKINQFPAKDFPAYRGNLISIQLPTRPQSGPR